MYISQLIAAYTVSQVLSGRNLTVSLPEVQARFPQATPQQRGGATDLSYGALRHYGEIEAYLRCLLDKPLTDERIRALLIVAIYQLLHDEADDFTVVNQAVYAVSQLKKPSPKAWAKGLVNAVLRNLLRKQEQLVTQVQSTEVAVYSYPQWWIDTLKRQYPKDWQAMLSAGNQHPPMTLRVNTNKMSLQAYLQSLAAHQIEAHQTGVQAITLVRPMPVQKLPGFNEGIVSVQDYGAQLAAPLLDVQPGMRVLDACCAPGGKTGHVLELAQLDMTALDSDEQRLQRVKSNLDRLQLTATLKVGDAGASDWHDGQLFDRILADVPCTASGIVRRHVDIKWLRRKADVEAFAGQQARILSNLWKMLAKGGKLLYVTCSVFQEENQRQVDAFLQRHADATLLPLGLGGQMNITHMNDQLIPTDLHDGFFYALLQKH